MDRKKYSRIVVFIMSLLCGMFACNIIQPEPYNLPNDLRQIIHLTKGDTLYYKYVWQTSWSHDSTIIFRAITDSGTWRNIPYLFESNSPVTNPKFYKSEYFLELRDSSRYERGLPYDDIPTGIILQLPLRRGHQWWADVQADSTGALVQIDYKIESVDKAIMIQNKYYYHAIHISSIDNTLNVAAEYFIVPGIGIVMEAHQIDGYYGKVELFNRNF